MKRIWFLMLCLLMGGVVVAQDEVITTRENAPDAAIVQLEEVMTNFRRPLFLTHAGDERLFVVEQGGIVYVYNGDERNVFLDVSALVTASANQEVYTERGLLGLAFHPDYAENGYFFVNYTDVAGHTVVARYQVSADDPNVADQSSALEIFRQQQPFPNHNGGHMEFGLDGYLYISLGDGGAAGDPLAAGQNPQTLLGSILRLDVDSDDGFYYIPEDNPFADGVDGAPEIWSYGLRNVWRFSFDRATGDMYIGDVGQNTYEEINFEPADSAGGVNYGWNTYEGNHTYSGSGSADGLTMPIAEYTHAFGCSTTGGYVYRGEALPDLNGVYFYSDYCTGHIWYAYRDSAGEWHSEIFLSSGLQVSSFGEDVNGELYVVHYGGRIYKLVPAE